MAEPIDVLIIGAGSAGLFMALGLADTARVTVVEAGADPGSPAPPRMRHEHLYPDHDWGYVEADRGFALVRGRVVGGSSTVNASAGFRGQPHDFAGWGPGWSWDDNLDAYRRVEKDVQFGDAPYHGDSGPIRITRLPYGAIDEGFHAACREAGHADAADHNAPGVIGIGPWPTNRDEEGGRHGTLSAVMPLLRDRVTLRADTVVRRLLVEGGRVTGVEVTGPGGDETLTAGLVVLAAGAFGSPEILLRSGVGPAAELEAEGVTPLVDLPGVGRNLHDHPWVMLRAPAADPDAPGQRPVSGSLLRWGIDGDVHDEGQLFPFRSSLYEDTPPDEISFAAALMRPLSRGSLRISGGRTVIRLAHLEDPSDRARMASVLAHSGALVDACIAAGVFAEPADPWWRDDDLVAAALSRVGTYNHPVGTCAMGDGPEAVVGRDLRVRGVEGLMVADASVMPEIPQANTNLASMMIGVRAADLVR